MGWNGWRDGSESGWKPLLLCRETSVLCSHAGRDWKRVRAGLAPGPQNGAGRPEIAEKSVLYMTDINNRVRSSIRLVSASRGFN